VFFSLPKILSKEILETPPFSTGSTFSFKELPTFPFFSGGGGYCLLHLDLLTALIESGQFLSLWLLYNCSLFFIFCFYNTVTEIEP